MMGRSLITLLLRLVRVLAGILHKTTYVSSAAATATLLCLQRASCNASHCSR
jgi:hypothetical protein